MAEKIKKRTPRSEKQKKMLIIGIIAASVILVAVVIAIVVATSSPDVKLQVDETAEIETEEVTEELKETEEKDTGEPKEELPAPAFEHGNAFSFVPVESGEPLQYTNPLTGLAASKDVSNVRPVAIMINNIKEAMPQIGVSKADILYECLAEGGITRLMMVTCDYEAIGTIGSVRSSREYYLDFAKNHDAIYVHAGGSEEAYSQIYSRDIAHLDGVRSDARTGKNVSGTVFYRDADRLKSFAYEHTLVTSGELIAKGISAMGYRNTRDGFSDPIKPVDWGYGVELSGDRATHIKIPYRSTHVAEYVYDSSTKKYMRFQFNHQTHIDGATGEQLGFENLLILNNTHHNTGDSYGHLVVTTTGSGSGLYFTGGRMIPVTWSKSSQDSAVTICDAEGYPLVVNRGKTAINVVDSTVWASLSYN